MNGGDVCRVGSTVVVDEMPLFETGAIDERRRRGGICFLFFLLLVFDLKREKRETER